LFGGGLQWGTVYPECWHHLELRGGPKLLHLQIWLPLDIVWSSLVWFILIQRLQILKAIVVGNHSPTKWRFRRFPFVLITRCHGT
jgi:hypothetical protein